MTDQRERVLRRVHVAAAALVLVCAGMAYSLWWGPLVHHASVWIVPGDIWGTFRDAHIVGWGGEGILYASNVAPLTGFISLPGMPALLAPVAMASGALHLTESLPFTLPHPSAWLLLGPVELSCGAAALFPLDALARRLGVPARTRAGATWLEAALLWPVVAVWGHPEDLVALGLGVYALMATMDGRWRRGALLLGLALAFQPLVVLIAPLAMALAPWRRWPAFVGCAAAPSVLLLVAPLAHAGRTTLRTLTDQPTYPSVNHPTPWLGLAHVLAKSKVVQGSTLHRAATGLAVTSTRSHVGPVVAGGPVRLVPIALAVLLAAVVLARRPSERTVWWLAALALALRCVFEAVMTPYYAVPALAIALVLAAGSTRLRLAVACVSAAACTYLGYRHAAAWSYYLPVTLTLLCAVAAARPSVVRARPDVPSDPAPAEPACTAGDPQPVLSLR